MLLILEIMEKFKMSRDILCQNFGCQETKFKLSCPNIGSLVLIRKNAEVQKLTLRPM